MGIPKYVGALMVFLAMVVVFSLAFGQGIFIYRPDSGQKPENPWSGTFSDGRVIDKDGLKQILEDHKKRLDCREATKYWKNVSLDCEDARDKRADFEGAWLQQADLKGAWLREAHFQGANLFQAQLDGAWLYLAFLDGVWFELASKSLPDISSISTAIGLSSLTYRNHPHALIELRKEFKESGFRRQEREITYAIKHSGFLNVIEDEEANLITKMEVGLGWVFFEQTCKWGMSPERPFLILFGLIFVFTIPYAQVISEDLYGKKSLMASGKSGSRSESPPIFQRMNLLDLLRA